MDHWAWKSTSTFDVDGILQVNLLKTNWSTYWLHIPHVKFRLQVWKSGYMSLHLRHNMYHNKIYIVNNMYTANAFLMAIRIFFTKWWWNFMLGTIPCKRLKECHEPHEQFMNSHDSWTRIHEPKFNHPCGKMTHEFFMNPFLSLWTIHNFWKLFRLWNLKYCAWKFMNSKNGS